MTAQQELAIAAHSMTNLAAYLNAAMANDAMARMEYFATYGVEWAPLGDGTAINDGAFSSAKTSR